MKAAIVRGVGQAPVYGDFEEPKAGADELLVTVTASALSRLSKTRAQGSHYSSTGVYPLVVGVDGVGKGPDGRRVYFARPRAPFGGMAERTVVAASLCIPLPEKLGDVAAAGLANPGMSCWLALKERARLLPGETVLINGATGSAGRLAAQVARHLGAKKIIVTGRKAPALEALRALGADETLLLTEDGDALEKTFREKFQRGVHVVLDYLWGLSAERLLIAAAKAGNEDISHRYVQIGSLAGPTIPLPSEVLRAIPLQLMGSGLGSVSVDRILAGIGEFFEAAAARGFTIDLRIAPLPDIARAWAEDTGTPRTVVTVG